MKRVSAVGRWAGLLVLTACFARKLLRCEFTKAMLMIGMAVCTLLFALPSHADWVLHHYETAGSNTAPETGYLPAGP
jgi:hypothetical protein